MNVKYFYCKGLSPDHTFRTIKWDNEEEISVSVILVKFPFWKRVKTGISYIFGKTGHWEHFEEIVLDKKQKQELIKFLQNGQ